jgi:hypothetical protein
MFRKFIAKAEADLLLIYMHAQKYKLIAKGTISPDM